MLDTSTRTATGSAETFQGPAGSTELPLVSVVIPLRNAERWISRAIQSVLDQCYPALELIVIDDGSTDQSLQIVRSFGGKLKYETGPNRGSQRARNRGLELATSDYVLFVDADDYVEGPHIRGLAGRAVATGAELIIGRSIREAPDGTRSYEASFGEGLSNSDLARAWLDNKCVQTGALLWRREFLASIGGWNESVMQNQDVELVLRALLHGVRTTAFDAGYSVWCDHHVEGRISRAATSASLESIIDYRYKLALEAKSFDPSLQLDFARSIYSLARVAYSRGHTQSGQDAMRKARALGLGGHHGTPLWVLASSVLGMERADKLATIMRRSLSKDPARDARGGGRALMWDDLGQFIQNQKEIKFRRAEEKPGGSGKLRFVLKAVQSHFRGREPGQVRILDIGCGRGDLSVPLAEIGYTVHGIDLFKPRIDEARAHAPPNATFDVGYAEDLDGSEYDAILCVEIIEHLDDPLRLLRTLNGLLRPGGLLIVTVPNGYSLLEVELRAKLALKQTDLGRRLLALKRRLSPVSEEALRNQHAGDFHLQHFTSRTFRSALSEAGFTIASWRNAGPLYSFLHPFGLISVRSRYFRRFDRLDSAIGPLTPAWCAGGWYVTCVHKAAT